MLPENRYLFVHMRVPGGGRGIVMRWELVLVGLILMAVGTTLFFGGGVMQANADTRESVDDEKTYENWDQGLHNAGLYTIMAGLAIGLPGWIIFFVGLALKKPEAPQSFPPMPAPQSYSYAQPQPQYPSTPQPQQLSRPGQFCMDCGKPNPIGQKFCGSCGKPL